MRFAEIFMAFVLAIFSIYLMWKSTELDIGYVSDQGPGGGAWPFWLSAIMLICTGFIAYNGYKRRSPPSQSEEVMLDRYALKMLLFVGGGLLGFIALIDIISMYGAMCVFLLYYLGFLGRHSIKTTLLISLITPIVFFFFFEALMRITMPKGLPFLEPVFNFMNNTFELVANIYWRNTGIVYWSNARTGFSQWCCHTAANNLLGSSGFSHYISCGNLLWRYVRRCYLFDNVRHTGGVDCGGHNVRWKAAGLTRASTSCVGYGCNCVVHWWHRGQCSFHRLRPTVGIGCFEFWPP